MTPIAVNHSKAIPDTANTLSSRHHDQLAISAPVREFQEKSLACFGASCSLKPRPNDRRGIACVGALERITDSRGKAPPHWRPSGASQQKERDRPFHDSRSHPPNACYGIHPLVTTGAAGGGAFPLPMPNGPPVYCAQPATLRRVSAAAVSRASVFKAPSFVMTTWISRSTEPRRH